jgi:cation diffusion facilitator CzcD-associated flavoprotein CzcO
MIDTVVLGAGPAGLAVAGSLASRGRTATIIEKAHDLAASWRTHYDRLRLHTVKEKSALPGLPFPRDYPRYVAREQMVRYLESYAAHFGIAPRLGCEATAIARDDRGGWEVATAAGDRLHAWTVVVATGANAWPREPALPGRERFRGAITHSRDYRRASDWVGRRVLVIGMGNTGAEIALDLAEHGVATTLSVRSPVNIVYREVLGRPTQLTALMLDRLPEAWGDRIALVFRNLTVGDLSRWGLRMSVESPLRDLRRRGRTPVIDVGTVARIKSGDIKVRPGIAAVEAGAVRFVDDSEDPVDAIILATGYDARLQQLFPGTDVPVDERGLPRAVVGTGKLQGVCFVGFDTHQPGGMLRTIGQQAEMVADTLAEMLVDNEADRRMPVAPAARHQPSPGSRGI